jgi:hypothetical protein
LEEVGGPLQPLGLLACQVPAPPQLKPVRVQPHSTAIHPFVPSFLPFLKHLLLIYPLAPPSPPPPPSSCFIHQVDTTKLGLSPEEAAQKPYLASMGIYVFKKGVLGECGPAGVVGVWGGGGDGMEQAEVGASTCSSQ